MAHTTIGRGLGKRQDTAAAQAQAADLLPAGDPGKPDGGAVPAAQMAPVRPPAAAAGEPGRPAAAEPDPAGGRVSTRYAGAMLLHAFYARAGAGALLPGVAGPDATLLTAVAMCFALGAHTTGQFKHLAPGEAGPLAGLAVLPGLRALRPRLAQIRAAWTR